jgi:beta-glucosidase
LLIQEWDRHNPATLSYDILTGQLREKLGFQGLIVTDALIMGGITKYASESEIYVKAIAAGADILLMPKNPVIAIDSVEKAVKDGQISENRIDASIQRIAKAKQKLITSNQLSLNNLAQKSSFKEVNEILNQTIISVVHLPLKTTLEGKNLIVVDDLLNCKFLDRQAPAVTIPQQRGYEVQLFDKRNLKLISHEMKPCILQIFIRGNPFRGNAGLTMDTQTIYQDLFSQKLIKGLIIYGSPYVLDWFRPLITKNIPWVFSYGEMFEAQEIACERLCNLSRNHNLMDINFL